MLLRRPLWSVLVVVAVPIAMRLAAGPATVMSAVGILLSTTGLAGLVLCAKWENLGLIWCSIVWSLAGALVGSMLSPSPPLHEPLEFLFGGVLCGWALGCVLPRIKMASPRGPITTVSQTGPVPPKWRALLWLTLGLIVVSQLFEPAALFFALRMCDSTIVVVALGASMRTASALPLMVYLRANRSLGREALRSGLLLCILLAFVLSVLATELPFILTLLRVNDGGAS